MIDHVRCAHLIELPATTGSSPFTVSAKRLDEYQVLAAITATAEFSARHRPVVSA
jgi:hypothetical protein